MRKKKKIEFFDSMSVCALLRREETKMIHRTKVSSTKFWTNVSCIMQTGRGASVNGESFFL